jgi:carboxypeptidase D
MLDRFMGVDIASIGGTPTDSRIDGEKGPATSVGGHPNSTAAEQAEKSKLEAAKWSAYYKSGQIVLVIVIIAASAWGYYIFRERRQRAGYKGLFGGNSSVSLAGARDGLRSGMGLENFRHNRSNRDVEAADFDESELDELHVETPTEGMDNYSVGSASDEGGRSERQGNGGTNEKGKRVEG